MIWLKENDILTGYVPMLSKEYNEQEIREMSKFSCHEGWSSLSCLVMQIQGIGFSYYGGLDSHYSCEVLRLIDISFKFNFECFLLPDDPRIEKYLEQIFEVFQNLTLYKVEELSESEIQKKVLQTKKELEHLVDSRTFLSIDSDISSCLHSAKNTSTRLARIQKTFAMKGYILTNNLFADVTEDISKKMYLERDNNVSFSM